MFDDVGFNLRELRTERGLSLRQLAKATGLSATLLSQLERGISQPSLKTLRALSRVFGSSASALFARASQETIVHISIPGQRSRISSPVGIVQYERLTPNNGQLEVLRGILHPGEWSSEEPWAHEAFECVYVVESSLTVIIGQKKYHVASGESISFHGSQPHQYGNLSDQIVTFIVSVSPPTP